MTSAGSTETAKRQAGEHAAQAVDDGMIVGLGTGSTAAYAIAAIGRAVDAGLDVHGVPTSYAARQRGLDADIPLVDLGDVERLDLAIDGADQVADRNLIKGGGAAHAREKVVATIADRFIAVVDETKLAGQLNLPVPVEVLPAAKGAVATAIRELGGEPQLREAAGKDGPVITDNGNLVLDGAFGEIHTPGSLDDELSRTPGVVEHGLFVGITDEIHVGRDDGVDVTELE